MADAKSPTSACVGEALQDQGFTDLGTLDAAKRSINCLAYYGITAGRTADTFDPNSDVTRSEMALFLYAAAKVMGIDLMGGDMMADFGDISELAENRQNAINSLARNGIMGGRGDMAFDPDGNITRAEMAVALVALVDKVPGSGVTKNDDGTFTVDVGTGTVDVFADAFGATSGPVNSAISAAYELGITSGVGDGTSFNPTGYVPRRDMATFITNALAHSNARPAGLTAQQVMGGIIVSIRDASFAPVANAEIDAFSHDTADAARAFNDDGTCSQRFGSAVEAGTVKCTIDPVDPVTGSTGNYNMTVTIADKGTTVWVWTGAMGDEVSSSTDLYELGLKPAEATANVAGFARVSTDFNTATAFRAKFGSTVTYTIQLVAAVDTDGDTTVDEILSAPPDAEGDKYTITLTFPNGAVQKSTVTMNASGSGTFDVSAGDPDPSSRGQSVAVAWTVDVLASTTGDTSTNSPQLYIDADTVTAATVSGTDQVTGTVTFSDVTAAGFELKAEAVRSHSPVANSDNPTTGNRITVTVTDQYGDPIGNVPVTAASTASAPTVDPGRSVFPAKARVTFPDGTVTLPYSYSGTTGEIETVTVTADLGPGPDGEAGNADDPTDLTATATVNWTQNGTSTTAADGTDTAVGPAAVLVAEADNNLLVLNVGGVPTVYVYDANDQFFVTGAPVTMAGFEENLAKVLATDDAGDITVASYKAGEADDVASFTWVQ